MLFDGDCGGVFVSCRIRAMLDPVRANAEVRVKQFEERKKRTRDRKVREPNQRPTPHTNKTQQNSEGAPPSAMLSP